MSRSSRMRHSVPFRSQKSLPFRADQTGTPNDMTNRGTERSEIHAMPLRTDAMFASTSAYVQTNGQSGCGDPGVAYPTLFARLFAQVQEVRNFTDQRQSGMISRCGSPRGPGRSGARAAGDRGGPKPVGAGGPLDPLGGSAGRDQIEDLVRD